MVYIKYIATQREKRDPKFYFTFLPTPGPGAGLPRAAAASIGSRTDHCIGLFGLASAGLLCYVMLFYVLLLHFTLQHAKYEAKYEIRNKKYKKP